MKNSLPLRVGQNWRVRDGYVRTIISHTGGDYPWELDNGETVTDAGTVYLREDRHEDDDLITLVMDTEQAALAGVKQMILPGDPQVRKGMPITTGVLDYFPLALAEVAVVSKAGNDQHNPGQPLHWDKTKSLDHADCIPRHLIDRGARDTDGMRHSAKLAWRALALLQTELENEANAA